MDAMSAAESIGREPPGRLRALRWYDAASWAIILALSFGAGLLYAAIFEMPGHPLVSGVFGLLIGSPILAYERRLLAPGVKRALAASSTPVHVLGSIGVYLVLILSGNTVAAVTMWLLGFLEGSLAHALHVPPVELVYSFAAAGTINFVMRMRDLLGPEVFTSFLIGRYRKPHVQERIFLFVDLVGSTALAERHGDIAAQDYLGRFFELIAEPVRAHCGTMEDYIGDMAFISWPFERGAKDAAAIRCVLAIAALTDKVTDGFGLGPGENPRFRAALHCGSVVTAEVGVYKRKIAYFGDAVNVTSRIEDLAKAHEAELLASRDVLDRMTVPDGITVTPLGAQAVHGRARPVAIAKLSWRGEPAARLPNRPALARAG
jgi:adenylate cyclase